MNTKRYYQDHIYQKELDARVLDCRPAGDHTAALYLDQTIFFPEGGGQSCDTGTINGYRVLDVQEEGNMICHTVQADAAALPRRGDTVHCCLDWAHRFDNMQRHCGEHILSGALHHLFHGSNKGFHMSEESMTIDIALEKEAPCSRLTMDMALQAEQRANEIVWQDLPVTMQHFDTRLEAAHMPLRKPLVLEHDITIVTIGKGTHPADCVACCGTHPSSTGQVGLIKVWKVEKNKDLFRLYFDAGQRAMNRYDRSDSLLTRLEQKFSAGSNDLLEKIEAQQQRHAAHQAKMKEYQDALICRMAEEIQASGQIWFDLDPLDTHDGLRLGKRLHRPLTALYAGAEHTLLLCSDGSDARIHCGEIVRASGLRGGGSATLARMSGKREELKRAIATCYSCFK